MSRVWDFSYFPMGDKVKDKHFKKENLTKTKALKFAKEYMQKNWRHTMEKETYEVTCNNCDEKILISDGDSIMPCCGCRRC